MKTLAIDFDGTYTAHPQLCQELAVTALSFGIDVVTVTSRCKTAENELLMRAAGIAWPIVFSHDKPKKLAAKEAGHEVCVWVDDQPHMIGDGTESLECVGVFENELRHALRELHRLKNEYHIVGFVPLIARLETVLGVSP